MRSRRPIRNPTRAAQIANAVGQELAKAAGDLSPQKEDGTEAVQATTIEEAQVPDKASSPKILQNLGVGLIVGLLLGLGVAVLRHVLDTRVRNEDDVRAVTASPILGVVAYDQDVPSHPVILRDQPLAAPSEAVRRLRTNLQFIDIANRPKSIVISSSIPGEGKSTIAINLAVSLADTGARVILVDADLRRPSIAEYLGIEGGVGLTTVLIGRAEVEDVVQPLGKTSLDLLPAGQIPPNPSELLGSMAMADLLERLSASYDMVLLDSPPLLPVTDAVVLSNLAGGALVVVGARSHPPATVAAVLGVVGNGRSACVRDCDEQDRSSRGCGVRLRQRVSRLCAKAATTRLRFRRSGVWIWMTHSSPTRRLGMVTKRGLVESTDR